MSGNLTGEREQLDNSTPLRKKDLENATVVQQVEAMGAQNETHASTHPQEFPEAAKQEVENANTPATGTSGRAGGKSAAADGGVGGVGHGQAPGGAKGTAGAHATAGGPFQSESGQTLETGKDYVDDSQPTQFDVKK